MTRQIPLLRGLAILAVVCNHAAGKGLIAMFWWTHRYSQITPPNFDRVGSLPYYYLVSIKQLTTFSVPAFLFISGFFISYAAHNREFTLRWKIMKTRILILLLPYTVWSLVIFGGDFLQGITFSMPEYIRRLALGRATGGYFFIPLLIQFYLLAPIIVQISKTKSRHLLLASALIQLTAITFYYLNNLGIFQNNAKPIGVWPCILWAFYFPFGVICYSHMKQITSWIRQYQLPLFIATLILGIISIIEAEILYHLTGNFAWITMNYRFSTFFYALVFILFFLSFDMDLKPSTRAINSIGTRSYGIYLLNEKVSLFVAKVTYHIAPWLLSQQILYQPVLIAAGAGIPLLFMAVVAKSPTKKFYRNLFG